MNEQRSIHYFIHSFIYCSSSNLLILLPSTIQSVVKSHLCQMPLNCRSSRRQSTHCRKLQASGRRCCRSSPPAWRRRSSSRLLSSSRRTRLRRRTLHCCRTTRGYRPPSANSRPECKSRRRGLCRKSSWSMKFKSSRRTSQHQRWK